MLVDNSLQGLSIVELTALLHQLATERNFYWNKLRQIELLCERNPQIPMVGEIVDILASDKLVPEEELNNNEYFSKQQVEAANNSNNFPTIAISTNNDASSMDVLTSEVKCFSW